MCSLLSVELPVHAGEERQVGSLQFLCEDRRHAHEVDRRHQSCAVSIVVVAILKGTHKS